METTTHRHLRQRLHQFFDDPHGPLARSVQAAIIFLILVSLYLVYLDVFHHEVYVEHYGLIWFTEVCILLVFTAE